MKHYGDITQIKGEQVPAVDIVVGGSPCQDLSIAGKRAGLDGERSGLFMEQIRIIKEMRANNEKQQSRGTNDVRGYIKPRFMVWENVPGAFSSNNGEDFRIVLEETARVVDPNACIPGLADGLVWPGAGCILGDRWSIAWRVHDAQFWGVPQRRRRIALVADFGGQSAPEILFERESVSRDFEQVGTEGQGIAADITRGAGGTGEPDIVVIEGNGARPSHLGDGFSESDISYTLNATERHAVAYNPAISFQERAGCEGGEKGVLVQQERTGALSTSNNQAVCYGIDRASFNQGKNAKYDFAVNEELAQTLLERGPGGVIAPL